MPLPAPVDAGKKTVAPHVHHDTVTVRSTTTPSVTIPIARPDEQGDVDKAEFGILTMVDTGGAWRNPASDIPRDGVIFDALVLLQTNSTLYKVIAKHKIVSSTMCGT
jgi:hypothetical protein